MSQAPAFARVGAGPHWPFWKVEPARSTACRPYELPMKGSPSHRRSTHSLMQRGPVVERPVKPRADT
jgi:hypothetical protein